MSKQAEVHWGKLKIPWSGKKTEHTNMQENWLKWKIPEKYRVNESKSSYGKINCGWEKETNAKKCVRHFWHRC